jgi:hypothetical protein
MADYQQKRVWVQRDGTPIRVKDMTTSHLENTVAMLRRAAPNIYDREVISTYIYATPPGGDMAMDMFDREFDAALERDPWDWLKRTPLVKAMRKEIKRRRAAADEHLCDETCP